MNKMLALVKNQTKKSPKNLFMNMILYTERQIHIKSIRIANFKNIILVLISAYFLCAYILFIYKKMLNNCVDLLKNITTRHNFNEFFVFFLKDNIKIDCKNKAMVICLL